jgi:hypothetical protein
MLLRQNLINAKLLLLYEVHPILDNRT